MRNPVYTYVIYLFLKIEYFLLNNSLRLAYVVCAEQTIEEQKIKFGFYGEMEGHICGFLIYFTLLVLLPALNVSKTVKSLYNKCITTVVRIFTYDNIICLDIFSLPKVSVLCYVYSACTTQRQLVQKCPK